MDFSINAFGIKDFNFFDFPKKISYKEYEKAIEHIIKDLKATAYSICTWGSIKDPGISDLDLMIVLEKLHLPLKYRSIYFMNKTYRNILAHPFIICNKNIAENAKFIYPDTKFKRVFGKNINFKIPAKNYTKYIRTCLLNDIIIRHLPRDFIKIFKSRKINVRETLLRLNSLAYSLSLYYLVTGKKIRNSDKYVKSIKNLRKRWFNLSKLQQKKNVFELCKDALRISIAIVDNFNYYLENNNIVEIDKRFDIITYYGEKNKTIFLRKWKLNIFDYYKFVSLPINLSGLLICYSKQNGILSNHIRKNFSPKNLECKFKYKKVAEKRIKILNLQTALIKTHKHLHFPAFFDFGYRPTSGILNKGVFILRKMKDRNIF